jgi:hypothetical protein
VKSGQQGSLAVINIAMEVVTRKRAEMTKKKKLLVRAIGDKINLLKVKI